MSTLANTTCAADAWRKYLQSGDGSRLDPQCDREFWDGFASEYDAHTQGGCERTLQVLAGLVRPDDSLLDVGAGTGRFAIPLSPRVRRVTALDSSPAMLQVLGAKARAAHIENIAAIQAEWPPQVLEHGPGRELEHDVVLSAWSLYRTLDIEAALRHLAAATRRTLIIVAGDGDEPPHQALRRKYFGGEPSDASAYRLLHGALWECGFKAGAGVVREERRLDFASPLEAARHFAPLKASSYELDRFSASLCPLLCKRGARWLYRYSFNVGLITWRRPQIKKSSPKL